MSFRLPSLVKLPGHKVFDYKPRYYDEDKEERERLARRRQPSKNLSDEQRANIAKENIQNLYSNHHRKYQSQSNVQSNIRLVVIILALLVLTYFIIIY